MADVQKVIKDHLVGSYIQAVQVAENYQMDLGEFKQCVGEALAGMFLSMVTIGVDRTPRVDQEKVLDECLESFRLAAVRGLHISFEMEDASKTPFQVVRD